ncbi:MAG: mannose-1-phosphate guanylyltransferase [Candidatus Delongbacteria bacterium]
MYALIMAGGVGARFWPKSRLKTPKHLLTIMNEKTMLENTIERLDGLIERDKCYIVTNKDQKDNILKSTNIASGNVLAEPFGKNTAAAIGYGAVKLLLRDPDAFMVVLPADHYIKDVPKFNRLIKKAVDYCKKAPDSIVTIGIQPTHPETGYGYIQIGNEVGKKVREVKSFAEKPNFETALRFLESKEFVWNSGMFIWKAETIIKEIKKHIPDLYDSLMDIKKALVNNAPESVIERIYTEMRSISIDYGVMENADNVKVLLGDFGWSDVGSWFEIYRLKEKDKEKNVIDAGKFISIDTEGCLVSSEDNTKLISCIGLRDMAVIDTKDSLLITPLSRSQDVKKIVDKIKVIKFNKVL